MKFWQHQAARLSSPALGGSHFTAAAGRVPLLGLGVPLIMMALVSALLLAPSGFRGIRSMWPSRLRRVRFTVGSTLMPWPTIVIGEWAGGKV